MADRKAVVLLSGGLDSAVTLYLARKKGWRCFCLVFDYGQLHRKEIICARRIARRANCAAKVIKIDLSCKGSSLLDRKLRIPGPQGRRAVTSGKKIPSTYVAARNIIFLSFALSYAETIQAQGIFIGAHSQDYSGYPDCRPRFYQAFRRVMSVGTKAGLEKKGAGLYAPLLYNTKAQIIKLGYRLGVPFELTWSCYRGLRHACGSCDSCYFRAKGFQEAGLRDSSIKGRV